MLPAGEFGGAEAQILSLVQGLTAQGLTAMVATYFSGEFVEKAGDAGIDTEVLRGGGLWRDYTSLRALVRTWRPDIIHTHGVRASIVGRLVGRAARIPIVTTVHSDLYYDYASPWKRKVFMQLEARTRGLSTRVIAVSAGLREILLKRGYDQARVVLIQNGIDVTRIEQLIAAGREHPVNLREYLHLTEDAVLILCVARLHPVKRHDVLIRAVGALPTYGDRPVHAVLVGDGGERPVLEALAEGVAPGRVHFLGARQDVCSLLPEADVFALTSQMEGLPISVLEAMVAGIPVVASRVGGLISLVDEGDKTGTGALFTMGDAADAVQAFVTALQDRDGMGTRGHARVVQYFSLAQMVDATARVYRDLGIRL